MFSSSRTAAEAEHQRQRDIVINSKHNKLTESNDYDDDNNEWMNEEEQSHHITAMPLTSLCCVYS